MQIATYILNLDGTVPDFVIDGGYFAANRVAQSPQDWTLVGVVDDSVQSAFATVDDLTEYLATISGGEWVDMEGHPVDIAQEAARMWALADNLDT